MTDPVLIAVRTALAAAYRQIAEWAPYATGEMTEDEWRGLAEQVENWVPDGFCCPLCQEVVCDGGCPLEPFRTCEAATNSRKLPPSPLGRCEAP